MNRQQLYKLNDTMRWLVVKERRNLRDCQEMIEYVGYKIKLPIISERDILDYVSRVLSYRFDSVEDFFIYSKLNRKKIHNSLAYLKKERKKVKDKLSRLPKKKTT